MSASAVRHDIEEFGALALDAIRDLSEQVRDRNARILELEAQLEDRDRELAEALSQLDNKVGEEWT